MATKTKKRKSSSPFMLSGGGGGQMTLASLTAPPPTPTSPQPLSRREKFELRVAAVIDRWNQSSKKFKLPKGQKRETPLAGMTLVQKFKSIVTKCLDVNDSDVKCATELVQAQKDSVKAAKKWWRPRPKTCDDQIARKFAKCRSMEMF